ncbi:ATP-binding protein [Methanospirillum hungatei]|uniref:ATP-binding protein n=1 Tax=Methanospirillum hungatei TaxID=2203 RepID=UPI00350E591A
MSSDLAIFFQDDYLLHAPFPDWDAFFVYLSKHSDTRVVIAIDEFPYLVQEDSSLTSLLQYYWDTTLGKTHLYLIVSGSSIGLVKSQLMHYKSPLYGRRTGQILLKPFRFIDYYPYVNDLRTAITLYAIFGGTPAYCLIDEPFQDIEEIVCQNLLREDAFLYRDVEFVLRMELKEPRYYYSILLSIAIGNTTIGLIANDCGLEKGLVSKYLATLADLQVIRRETPVLSGSMSRKGVYLINDNLFSFWFRFVYPYRKEIEMGESEFVYHEYIAPQLSHYIGPRFEEIILDIFYLFNKHSLFPIRFSDIGRWWHKEQEIDLVAIDPKSDTILFCECKWQDNVQVEKIVQSLRKKAALVKWGTSERKEMYCVIGRSLVPYQEDNTIITYDLDDIEQLIRSCLNLV